MKFCKRDNCDEIAIPRGKYCEKHKTGNRNRNRNNLSNINPRLYSNVNIQSNIDHFQEEFERKEKIRIEKIRIENEENRKIIQEQEIEYQKTVLMDQERIRLKEEDDELQKILQISELTFNDEKRKKIPVEPEDNYFLIQFNIPNGKKIKRKFSKTSSVQDLKNYLDIYFIDTNLEIKNYNLCYYSSANCKQIIDCISNNEILENIFNSKNFALFIINNDA